MTSRVLVLRAYVGVLFIVLQLQSMERNHQVMKISDDSSRNIQLDFNNAVFRTDSSTASSSSSTSSSFVLTRINQSKQMSDNNLLSVRHTMPMSSLTGISSSLPSQTLSALSSESLTDTSTAQDLSSNHQLFHLSSDSCSTLSYDKFEATLLTEADVDENSKTDARRQETTKSALTFHDWMELGQSIRQKHHVGQLRYLIQAHDLQRKAEFMADPSRHKVPQNILQYDRAHGYTLDILRHLINREIFDVHVLINEFPSIDHLSPEHKKQILEFLDRIKYQIYETDIGPSFGQLKPSSQIDVGKVANIVRSYENYCKYAKHFSNWPLTMLLTFDKNLSAALADVKPVEDYGWLTWGYRALNSADHYEFIQAVESNSFNINLLKIDNCARLGKFTQVDPIANQIGLDTTSHGFNKYLGKHIRRHVDRFVGPLGNQLSKDAIYLIALLIQNKTSEEEIIDCIISKMTKDSPLYREFFHESGICKLVPARITISEAAQQQLRASIGKSDAAPERTLLNKLVSVQPQDSQVVTAAQVGIDHVVESLRFGSYDKDLSQVYINNARHVYHECLLSKPRIGLILKHFKDHYASLNQAKNEQILLNIIDQLGTFREQFPHSDNMHIVNDALDQCLSAELLNRQGKTYESYQAIKDVAELLNPIEEFDFLAFLESAQLDQVRAPAPLERMVRDQMRSDLAQIRKGGCPTASHKVASLTPKSLDVLLNEYDQRAQQKLSIMGKESILIRRALISRSMSQVDSTSTQLIDSAMKDQLNAELDELAFITHSADMKKDYPQTVSLIEEQRELARYHIQSGDILLALSQVDECWRHYERIQNDQDKKCDVSNKSHLALVSPKEIILTDIAYDLLNSRDCIGVFKSINEERYSQEQRSLSHLVKKLVNDTADASHLSKIPKEARELAVSEALICASAAQEFIDQGHLRKPAQLLELGFAILEKQSQYSKIFGKSAYQRVVEIATHPIDFVKEQAIGLAHLADLALRGLHFAQQLSFSDPLSWRDSINAWKQAGEVGISITQASRELVAHAGAMTPAEWDAQIKSIMAHAGRGTVDLLAADLLLSGADEGAAVLKSRTEKLIRSIPLERLNEFSQSLGKARVIWDKAAEAFALERSPLPALAGEAGALEGLPLAEGEAGYLNPKGRFSKSIEDSKGGPVKNSNKLQWTPHGYKHVPPKGLSWKEIIKITEHADALYKPGINIQELELYAWQHGTPTTNGKNWKVFRAEDFIGAKNGKATVFMRVECSSNTIHGHPILEADYKRYLQ